jgi:hypothetical protein
MHALEKPSERDAAQRFSVWAGFAGSNIFGWFFHAYILQFPPKTARTHAG